MTSRPRKADAPAHTPPADPPPTHERKPARSRPLVEALAALAVIFAALLLLHLPLLGLPYYWDEAGYFIPAARDIYATGDLIPRSTLSNAHPPLVMAYLALAWKLFGFSITAARAAMVLVASLALLGLFRLARRLAGHQVAVAACLCTALYPVFFAQSSLAHLDMGVAALTTWALVLYLPARLGPEASQRDLVRDNSWGRRAAVTLLLALAALAKETAVLVALTLCGWELLCWMWRGRGRGSVARYFAETRAELFKSLLLLVSLVPLALWFAYHYQQTGYVFGNPEFFRYNVESTLNAARVFAAAQKRLWQVTGYMHLFLLTGPAALVMLLGRPALGGTGGGERRRISVPVQVVFALLIAAHVVALSLIGGAVLARYMLPVVPLVILICVSTLRRRVRRWRALVALACAGFALGLFVEVWRFVSPWYTHPWEDNLAYRDFIMLHQGGARALGERYAGARVLTAWPATDELKNPYMGYTDAPFAVVPVESFTAEALAAAARRRAEFDVALVFSTHGGVSLDEAARLLGGEVTYGAQRRGQWVALVELSREAADEPRAGPGGRTRR